MVFSITNKVLILWWVKYSEASLSRRWAPTARRSRLLRSNVCNHAYLFWCVISSAPPTKTEVPAPLERASKLAASGADSFWPSSFWVRRPSILGDLVPIRPHFVPGIVVGHHHNLINFVSDASKHQCDIKWKVSATCHAHKHSMAHAHMLTCVYYDSCTIIQLHEFRFLSSIWGGTISRCMDNIHIYIYIYI